MRREFDLTSLRSFVAVADAGGVTRAASILNLSQSAVSMQIKRLEDVLQVTLLDRAGRGVQLTTCGEQLLGYARRLLSMNDEAFGRLTHEAFEGEIVLGVPHDIVYPAIPQVLRRFGRDYPKMRVRLISSFTRELLSEFERGACDVILTTEISVGQGGETLVELPLIWVGAPDGIAWKERPLRLAYEQQCIFRQGVQAALDRADIPWAMAVEGNSSRAIEATVSADLAVHTSLAGSEPANLERIEHGGTLPDLSSMKVNLYVSKARPNPVLLILSEMIREAYGSGRNRREAVANIAEHDLA
jgi:DNA-binding transcriptional LysR family regulator